MHEKKDLSLTLIVLKNMMGGGLLSQVIVVIKGKTKKQMIKF